MQSNGVLDALPLWGLFAAIVLVVLLSVECGYRLGKYRHSRSKQEKEAPVGAMVGATLGLLAFILAFTFGLAAARFDTRREVLLDEANAIGTTYLRAGMLPDRREEIRALLREYVDVRLKAVLSNNIAEGMRQSLNIQDQLWAQAVAVFSLATMGYHSGLAGTSRSLAVLAVAFTFSAVIGLIADLDRPQEGGLKVSQQALIDLRQSMNAIKP